MSAEIHQLPPGPDGRDDAPHSVVLGVLDPQLAGAVDDDLGHRVALEPLTKRR